MHDKLCKIINEINGSRHFGTFLHLHHIFKALDSKLLKNKDGQEISFDLTDKIFYHCPDTYQYPELQEHNIICKWDLDKNSRGQSSETINALYGILK